ncbi:PREDICTED: secretin receptor [Myotis brandtii]|uniref:secretin receptor n=1 Tax=Myotis brandtii TaxID=109478 RepID=UPI000703D499|nr:PREDICTED: secretin receptor [Myotis brandtii]
MVLPQTSTYIFHWTLGLLLAGAAHTVGALPRLCDVLRVLREERDQCLQELSGERTGDHGTVPPAPGCPRLWENMSCWPSSEPGQTVEVECPRFLWMFTGRNGSMFRNCTPGGWSEIFPRPDLACGVNVNDSFKETDEKRHEYLLKLKVMYTVGYSSSLVMLLVALSILCSFRRLHCTRNYIHMHLFVSFILRALSNFIKDAVLFSDDDDHCETHRVGCKLIMVFFQYCILANYAWLLAEGLYLHTLLAVSFFSERKCLQGCVALGWGSPAIFVASWALTRHFLEDAGPSSSVLGSVPDKSFTTAGRFPGHFRCFVGSHQALSGGCWPFFGHPMHSQLRARCVTIREAVSQSSSAGRGVLDGPLVLCIVINFILFVNILRILMRKLRTQETRGNEVNHYKRLAKSTLLLIPLFGAHYIIFAFSPDDAMEIQLFFELALGSFQGLVVAVLYCFLNGEVQLEVQKKWRQWHLRELSLRPMALSNSSSIGTSSLTHGTKASPSEPSRGTCRASVI